MELIQAPNALTNERIVVWECNFRDSSLFPATLPAIETAKTCILGTFTRRGEFEPACKKTLQVDDLQGFKEVAGAGFEPTTFRL